MTTKGIQTLLAQNITTAAAPDIRMIVFKGTFPAPSAIKDLNTVADAIATTLDEAAASGYSRANAALDLTITVTEDDTNDKVTITAPAPTLTSVAAGETWTAVGYYLYNAGADSTKELIGIDVPTPATIDTNGQNVTLPALLIELL